MRGNPFRVGPFTGGLNLRDKAMEMPPNHIPAGWNVYAGADGVIKKRDPSVSVVTSFPGANNTLSVWTLKQINFITANYDSFFASLDSSVFLVNAGTGVATNISGAMTFTLNNFWSVVQGPTSGGQGPLYAASGSNLDTPIYWTGAGNVAPWTASVGTLPAPKQMISFKNRIIMWGPNISSSTALKASKVGDPRDWDTTSTASDSAWQTSIDPNETGAITAIWPFGSYVLVFKRGSIHIVYDLDTGANRLLTKTIGSANFSSLCDTPYGVAFHGSDGHMWITDATKQTKLTDILSNEGSNATTAFPTSVFTIGLIWPQPVGISSIGVAATAYWNDRLIVSTPGNGTWWYDFPTKAWWMMGQNGYFCLATKKGGPVSMAPYAGEGTTLFGGSATNTAAIHAMYVPNFSSTNWSDGMSPAGVGGVPYTTYFETPPLAPTGKGQDLNIRRRYHAMRGYISGVVNVKYALDSLDAAPTYTTLGTSASSGIDAPQENTFYSMGVGNSIRFRFDSGIGLVPWAVHPFNVYTQPRTD